MFSAYAKYNSFYYPCRDRSQKSRPLKLKRGKVYFIEVVMKEAGGGDHLSVGVRLPRRGGIRPVSKRNLYQRPPGRLIVSIAS